MNNLMKIENMNVIEFLQENISADTEHHLRVITENFYRVRYENKEKDKDIQLVFNIKPIAGCSLENEQPYTILTFEVLLKIVHVENSNNNIVNLSDNVIARFEIVHSFFKKPFDKKQFDKKPFDNKKKKQTKAQAQSQLPHYFRPPSISISVEDDYRRKSIPRLLICSAVCLLKNLYNPNFNDDTILYIDVDGSDKVNNDQTFWDYIGMEQNIIDKDLEEDLEDEDLYSDGYEKRITVSKLDKYLFMKDNIVIQNNVNNPIILICISIIVSLIIYAALVVFIYTLLKNM